MGVRLSPNIVLCVGKERKCSSLVYKVFAGDRVIGQAWEPDLLEDWIRNV